MWIILALCIAKKINYVCKVDWKIGNIILIIVSVLFVYLYIKRTKEKTFERVNINRIVFFGTIVLFLAEIYICYNIFFETGWDSGSYIIPAARMLLAKADVTSINETYFKTYPNNLLLVHIYYVLLRVNEKIGIFSATYQLMIIVIFNCWISSISCWLIYVVARKNTTTKYALLGYFIAIALLGISPWNVICYSDAIALFFPIFIIYIYIRKRELMYI